MGHDDLLSRFDITFAPDPSRKESLVKASATILTLVAAMGCGGGGQTSHTVLVAPRLNLLPYGSVGLVTFSIEKAKGTLNEFATRRFEEYLLAAQSGIEVQEFSQADSTQALSGARGVPEFAAQNPNDAYGHLINRLVYDVTYDLRSTWVKQ